MRSPGLLRVGDLVGFSGYSAAGLLINLGSFGVPFFGLSHIGVVAEFAGRAVIFESTTLCKRPCLIQKARVSGVQCHPIDERISEYFGKVWRYPLSCILTSLQRRRLSEFCMNKIGTPYDMGGAFRSGGKVFSWLEGKLYGQDMQYLFCSEFCAAAHRYIDVFRNVNSSRWSPNSLIREEYEQGSLKPRRRIK